jgi:hypothetical protein
MDTTGQHIAVNQLLFIIPFPIGVGRHTIQRLITQCPRIRRGVLWVNAYQQG